MSLALYNEGYLDALKDLENKLMERGTELRKELHAVCYTIDISNPLDTYEDKRRQMDLFFTKEHVLAKLKENTQIAEELRLLQGKE